MSDGRGGPDVPRPDENAGAAARAEGIDSPGTNTPHPHGTTPSAGGGFTDPTPGQDGIIVQGGRTTSGFHDSTRAIGPKQDDPRAIGPKQDDPRAIGPKQDDPRAIGPKQDDPRAIGPKPDDPRAIGPKQDDPRAIGPKQDDPRTVGHGIIVQGGRTGHPGSKARQKRARTKMKTMALVIGGILVAVVGGAVVGRQLGHDPATIAPQAVGTPSGVASAIAPTPSLSPGDTAPAAAPSGSVPAAVAETPASVASIPPSHGASPGRSTPSAQPKPSGTPAPAAVPVLALRPSSVQEYCGNGEWPNTLVVRNSGSGHLNWSVGRLPQGVTVSRGDGSLDAGGSQVLTLGGRTEQQPANGRFTIAFTSNGGSGQVTVTCA
ncbi:hypothetical protein ACFV9E_39865 [Streptomyces sp. NPDC059835]|uniref:hypothetical protein n=1 Tax=Streptomyces sp. NPDC059835 TaxID=3346967 RepID=UPI003666EAD4